MKRNSIVLCACLLGLGSIAQAEILAGYDFDTGAGVGTRSATVVGTNVTASDFNAADGMINRYETTFAPADGLDAEGNAFGTMNLFAFGGAGTNFFADGSIATNLKSAVIAQEYVSFSVTPDDGYELHLSHLTFRTFVETLSDSADRWALFSSVDGYFPGSEIATGQTTDVGTWNSSSNNVVVDLSASSFQGLDGGITFRLYIYGNESGTNSVTAFDKVVVHGSLTPGSTVLVGYDFDADATNQSAATVIADKMTASQLTSPMAIAFGIAYGDNSGLDGDGASFGSTATPGAVGIGVDYASTSFFADAVAGNDYITFTVTPDVGSAFRLSHVRFKAAKEAGSSVDEYAVTDASGVPIGSAAIITNVTGLIGAYDVVSVDLSGTMLEEIAAPTEFRIYAWGRGTSNTSGTLATIDKLTLHGAPVNASGRNSHFWMTLRPRAGTGSASDSDLVLANGYRSVDLGSPDLSCTRVDTGSNWIYQISWSGNSLLGSAEAETLQFSVVVDAFSGADYLYSSEENASSVTSLGAVSDPTDIDNRWGVGGDYDIDDGQSIRMSQQDFMVNGTNLSTAGFVLENSFDTLLVRETNGGHSHKIIFGTGTNLPSASFQQSTATYGLSGESFSVTGAGSNTGARQWAVEQVNFSFVVRNPALTAEDAEHPFADIKDGHSYGPAPYEPTTSNKLANAFPEFSWNLIPRTMLIRKGSNSFTTEESEKIANRYDFVVFEKANGGIDGYHDKAASLKAVNPDIKTVYYWNSRIYFGHNNVDDSIDDHYDEYINPYFTIRDGLPTYNQGNPDLLDWWVGVCLKMMGLEPGTAVNGTPFQPSNIDGTFVDKTGVPSYMLAGIYTNSPDTKFMMNNNGGNRSRLPYLDGTYREGWTEGGSDEAIAYAIALASETGKNKKLTMLRNPTSGKANEREMEDAVDFVLGVYLAYAEEYAYFYHQQTVDATDPQWQWLTDYYDQFQRPLGAPLGDAIRDGKIYSRSFEHCDLFLDLDPDSGASNLARILWKNDIGSPALAGGGFSSTDDTYTLQGGGNISGTGDNFFYLSDLHYGNGEVAVCINSLDNTHAEARAGVMFRERNELASYDEYIAGYSNGTVLVSGARTVAVVRDPAGQMQMVYRSATNGTLQTAGTLDSSYGPYAKLARCGDTFTGTCSPDGQNWTDIAQVTLTGMAEKVEMGMALCSGNNNALAEAVFSAFSRTESEPVADAQSVTLDEDTSVRITLTGSDPSGGTNLIYTVKSQPANGTLSGTAPALIYTPNTNYHGADSFSFTVNDGFAGSKEATVSIMVDPVNDAPVAEPISVATRVETPIAIGLPGNDPDGTTNLTFAVVASPLNGTLSGIAPDLVYTPSNGYAGYDSFTFEVADGSLTSTVVAVEIEVTSLIYWDRFDHDGLDVNPGGVGGGATSKTLSSPSSWSDNGDATFSAGGNYQDASLLYSTNAYQSAGGFELTVHYTCSNVGTYGRNLFGFGLLEDAGSHSVNSNPFVELSNVYSIGVNLIAEGSFNVGLNFADGLTKTSLDSAAIGAGTDRPVVIRVESDGGGGADWSYSVAGVEKGSGNIATFDFSRSFHFAAYGQDNERTKIIHSVALKLLPESGYSSWAASFGLTGDDALASADVENGGIGDGYDNLAEYALGMNPTNADAGSRESVGISVEGGTNWFEYVHGRRLDYAAQGLSYLLIGSTNLLGSVLSTNAQDQIHIGPVVGDYEPVTNRYLTDDPEKFMQLKIRQE
ncbi:Ig-like domain-containing protein [Pontiellaceae bacterium B12227]|nr:Ig-like domain-containing protein [Pontiellaceae bacterium B12227]